MGLKKKANIKFIFEDSLLVCFVDFNYCLINHHDLSAKFIWLGFNACEDYAVGWWLWGNGLCLEDQRVWKR